jgi:hypothetical protein
VAIGQPMPAGLCGVAGQRRPLEPRVSIELNASQRRLAIVSSPSPRARFRRHIHGKERPMRRLTSHLVIAALLLAGSVSLSGCIVAAPRPVHHVRVVRPAHAERARVWVPGHWGPRHAWVEAHWRYR